MSGYLTKINMKIPYSDKVVDIRLNGKTLILVGGNGCGKTRLLSYIYEKLRSRVVEKDNDTIDTIERRIRISEIGANELDPTNSSYIHVVRDIENLKTKLEELKHPFVTLSDLTDFVTQYHSLRAVLLKFEAGRTSDILKPSSVSSIDSLKVKDQVTAAFSSQTTSSIFEEFLLTSITNQAFFESTRISNNPEEAERIDKWFKKLETDLQQLFEDNDLKLVFNTNSLSFEIHQPNKAPYSFQQLSSGFSSIMAVYADLVGKISLRSMDPEDLTGVVMIDEIDAHLHVSLQKKILSFLTKSFPKVQFIVTTHSPFVVSSVSDAVIYDLTKLEQVEDLSMYSYEAVLEGLFGVLPISNLLQLNIESLAKLLKNSPIDIYEVESILAKLPQDECALDSESLYFVNSAKLAINKAKRL